MHQLLRRTAFAVMGIGLGVTAALTVAAAPSAAQPDIEPPERVFIEWSDFNVPPAVGAGDVVTGSGWLKDRNGAQIGTVHKTCNVLKLDPASADWLALCNLAIERTDGDQYLAFLLRWDNTADRFLDGDGALIGGTDSHASKQGDAGFGWCTAWGDDPPPHGCTTGADAWLAQNWLKPV